MKQVSPKVQQSVQHVTLRSRLSALAATGVLLACTTVIPMVNPTVSAQSYQDQINALQADNANKRASVDNLLQQASSFQDAISKLQAQIDGLQNSINANIALQNDLQSQIKAAQDEIDRQRSILASDVKAMYVDGTPDTVVLMATSKNLSDYVDKQEYRSRVQGKLQTTLKKIAALQKQLQVQKAKVESLLKEQQAQQARLDTDRAEQQRLLNMNESERSNLNSQISANNSKVAELRAAQAAAIRRMGGSSVVGDSGDNTYPARWKNAPLDAYLDSWGMYTRECVSYTAWKVNEAYGNMPYWGGIGNANQWPGNARASGIPVSSTPKPGTVGIAMWGYYGHSVWVEGVDGNYVIVSEYNYDWAGNFRRWRYPASTFVYLDFGAWNR